MNHIDKLDIADQMLDSAICEFLDKRNYFTAINLAGVAEELYGKFVRVAKNQAFQDELIAKAIGLSIEQGGPEFSFKEMKNVANHVKNSIKHFDSGNDRYILIDEQNEARLSIAGAIENHNRANRTQSKEVLRFIAFAQEYVARLQQEHEL